MLLVIWKRRCMSAGHRSRTWLGVSCSSAEGAEPASACGPPALRALRDRHLAYPVEVLGRASPVACPQLVDVHREDAVQADHGWRPAKLASASHTALFSCVRCSAGPLLSALRAALKSVQMTIGVVCTGLSRRCPRASRRATSSAQ